MEKKRVDDVSMDGVKKCANRSRMEPVGAKCVVDRTIYVSSF